jgi:aminoglycoside phosphotransferase (APT) family kinase protein
MDGGLAPEALKAGDGDWHRARGVARHQAVMLIPYYRETNPAMAAQGRRTVGQVLADIASELGHGARLASFVHRFA